MLTFAFNVLVLALAGIALYFAYQTVKKDFEAKYKRLVSVFRLNASTSHRTIKALEARIAALEATANKTEVPVTKPFNPFSKSEERHIKEQREMPSVVGMR